MNTKLLITSVFIFILLISVTSFFVFNKETLNDAELTLNDAELACVAEGGRWEDYQMYPERVLRCNHATSDEGKPCNDSNQCESECLAPEGDNRTENLTGKCYGYESAYSGEYLLNGKKFYLAVD